MRHSQDQLQVRKVKGDRKYGDIPKSTAKQSVYQNAAAIKDEPVDISNENKSDQAYVDVKNEPGDREDMTTEGDSVDVVEEVRSSDAATIKQELDIGATVLQPPDMHFMLQPCKPEPADTTPQASTIPQHQRSHYSEGRKHCSLQLNLSNLKIKNCEYPFRCDVCSKRFKQKSKLTQHIIIHTNERPYCCTICSKRYKRKYNLVIHLKSQVCSKRFGQKSEVTNRWKIHTSEPPFSCEGCAKSFHQKRKNPAQIVWELAPGQIG